MHSGDATDIKYREYLELFDLNPLPMWVYELKTLRFLAVNLAAVSSYGYSRDEFMAMTIADIRPPLDVGRLLENVDQVTEGLDRAGLWRHRRKDGTLIAVDITSQTVTFEGRKCELVIADDVTDSQLESERLSMALDVAKLTIWEITLPGYEVLWEDISDPIFGGSPKAHPRTFADFVKLIHPEDRERVADAISNTANHGAEFHSEFRMLRPDQSIRWHAVVGRRICGPNEAPVRIMGVSTDTTTRRDMEKQLFKARQMALLGRLADGIAHDFNNLLTVITGHAELLLHQMPEWNPVRGQVDEIRRAARRAANLTLKLLAFSRSDQSEESQPEILDLNHIVRDLQSLLRKICGDTAPARVTCDTTKTLIRASRNSVDQLIMNLCMTVSELLPAGSGIRLTLDQVHVDVPPFIGSRRMYSGPFVTLLVSPALEELPPPALWDNSGSQFVARPLEKAMGLGFAIVQGILEESGGFLEMLTAPGYGPCVRILFPAAAGTEAPR